MYDCVGQSRRSAIVAIFLHLSLAISKLTTKFTRPAFSLACIINGNRDWLISCGPALPTTFVFAWCTHRRPQRAELHGTAGLPELLPMSHTSVATKGRSVRARGRHRRPCVEFMEPRFLLTAYLVRVRPTTAVRVRFAGLSIRSMGIPAPARSTSIFPA